MTLPIDPAGPTPPGGASAHPSSSALALAPEYAALRDLVARARHGEIAFATAPRLSASDDLTGLGAAAPLVPLGPMPPVLEDTDDPDGEDLHDDAALKLPSGWYADAAPAASRTGLRPELKAATYGLAAGLVVLIPLALALQGAGSAGLKSGPTPVTALGAEPVRMTDTESGVVPVVVHVRRVEMVEGGDPLRDPAADTARLEAARAAIVAGDVSAARTLLATADAARDAKALFLLAETYDPNMLAAWGTRGANADADRARTLYRAARALGHDRADGRLAALK